MKTLLKIGGSILICLILLLLAARVTGFEPRDCRNVRASWTCAVPGLWLKGNLVTTPVDDWSFTDQYAHLKVQTRTWYLLPHSVTTDFATYNGQLYIESTYPAGVEYPHGRSWNEHVARDPHVRIKIGDQLFDRTLLLVTDPAEKEAMVQAKGNKYPPGSTGLWREWKAPPLSRAVVYRVMPG